jgi:hypothetical protein
MGIGLFDIMSVRLDIVCSYRRALLYKIKTFFDMTAFERRAAA